MPAKMLLSRSSGAKLFPLPEEPLMRASPVPIRSQILSAMEMSPSSSMLLRDEQKMIDIERPHHHDVLCGRGVTTNRHPGNESFRSLVGLNKEIYVSSTKRQKMSISRSIVEAVRSLDPPGRFLEKHAATGLWSDIGNKKAVEKTSQALRDGAASLRKQLSADLGDPEFLNAVFDMDDECENPKTKRSKTKPKGKESTSKGGNKETGKGKAGEKDKENNQDAKADVKENDGVKLKEESHDKKEKIRISDKNKPAKELPAKRGHRRTRSNPLTVSSSHKHQHRRLRAEPSSPSTHSSGSNYPVTSRKPPSPHSPHSHSEPASQPTSPMSAAWGGLYSDGHHHGSHVRGPPRPSYDHHSSPHFSPYSSPPSHMHYHRSQSFDYYHHGPPPPLRHAGGPAPPPEHRHDVPPRPPPSHHPHPRQWSYGPPPYHHGGPPMRPHSPIPCHSQTPPTPSSGQHPQSPLPQGPLPPGRHQFSPSGYHAKPPPSEWSPRVIHRYRPSRYYSHYGGDSRVGRSPGWRRSVSPSEQYNMSRGGGREGREDYRSSSDANPDTNGLSVPTLGVEIKPSRVVSAEKVSGQHRSSYGSLPPRHHGSVPSEFTPPPPSPRYRRSHSNVCSSSHYRSESPASPSPTKQKDVASETKSTNSDSPKLKSPSSIHSTEKVLGSISLSDNCTPTKREEHEVRDEDRTSLNMFGREEFSREDAGGYESEESDNPAVDDISMSPIPFDREDPTTLMQLPENILTLPISPCGPNDDPVVAASR